MLSASVCFSHSSGAAARIEKYIANNAAKNMSSLESHTMVPTLTMLGRVSEWIRLVSMAGAAVTGSLLPRDQHNAPRGAQSVPCLDPGATVPLAGGLASNRAACRFACAGPGPRGYCPAAVHPCGD